MMNTSHALHLVCRIALAVAFVAAFALTPSQFALAQSPRLSAPGQAWEEWRTRTGTASAAEREAAREAGKAAEERRQAVRDARAQGARAGYDAADAIGNHIATALGSADQASETLGALERAAREAGFGRTADAAARLRAMLDRSGLVDPADRNYEPREAPDGQPDVPARCEGNPACQQCYGAAMDKLDNTRYRLDRLMAIYTSTYSEAKGKIAFADGVSGFHGMSALAWQKYKVGVMQSLKNLDRSYDSKYAELMETLLDSLKDVAQCENDVMRVPDWYDRFGYVYYLFMKDRYKRPPL